MVCATPLIRDGQRETGALVPTAHLLPTELTCVGTLGHLLRLSLLPVPLMQVHCRSNVLRMQWC